MRLCRICRFNDRKEIDGLLSEGLPYREVALQVAHKFPGIRVHALEQTLSRHFRSHISNLLQKEEKSNVTSLNRKDIDALVENLLSIANTKVQEMSPKELRLGDLFKGQQILIELRKMKMQEDAMGEALGKLFGPSFEDKKEEVIDSENKSE